MLLGLFESTGMTCASVHVALINGSVVGGVVRSQKVAIRGVVAVDVTDGH